MHDVLLDEFRFDWELSGKSERTVLAYIVALRSFFEEFPTPDLTDAKSWIAASEFVSVRRKRGQALRAFGRWSHEAGDGVFPWWKQVPLAGEKTQPQPTATEEDYRKALKAATTLRDRTVVEILWWCGLRRGELAVLDVEDLNLADGYLVVRQSKTGSPRVVPLSPSARRSIRRLVGSRMTGSILGMSSNAIRLLLQRKANLTGADLEGANLEGANLRKANLTGADLEGARLSEADLRRAKASEDTTWPEGFDPVAAGVIFN